jgi:hypothetical protein
MNASSAPAPAEKACTGCQRLLPLTEYHRHTRKRDGRQTQCRACRSAAHVAYYTANREKYLAYTAAWRAAHPEKRRAYEAAYYAANREKILAYQATYYAANREANREKRRARSAAYYAANREKVLAREAAKRAAKRAQVQPGDTGPSHVPPSSV